jgi:hypothetical protein
MPQLYMIIPVGGLDAGHPDQGLPGGRPPHVGNRPPGSWGGEYPSGQPLPPGGPVDPGWGSGWGGDHVGNWVPGQEHPGNRPPGGGNYPTGGPIVPPQGGTEVPADEYQPLPPPEDIYSQYVVSVWNPKTASWTTKSYPPR